jgi:hypothetical protein
MRESRGFANLLSLNGEEWLRLFASELNMSSFSGWCTKCRGAELSGAECTSCHIPLIKLDSDFWRKVGEKIRRALPKNKTLLRDVKAAWKTLYGDRRQPTFPAEIQWLARAWTDAGNPPHRPFDPKVHYNVANWVRSLQERGLSQEEIIDLMDGTFEGDYPDGPITRGKKDYAKIAVQDLRMLRHKFKELIGYVPGSLLNREEMWRTLEWVDHQRANPMARLRGERVRNTHNVGDSQNTEDRR